MKVKSKAQAGLFGMVAGGDMPSSVNMKGLSMEEAHKSLRGVKVKKLPQKVKRKKGKY